MTLNAVLLKSLCIAGLAGLFGCSSVGLGGSLVAPANHEQSQPGQARETLKTLAPPLSPPVIIETRTAEPLDVKTLTQRLKSHNIILLGELHDNPHHHQARAQLIEALGSGHDTRPPLTLVVEQLPMGAVIGPDIIKTGTDLLTQLNRAGFREKAWGWPLHEPVFKAALAQGMAVHGGNLVPGQSMQLFRQGESSLPKALQGLLEKAPLSDLSQKALDKALVDGHCGQLPETMLKPMGLVQRATDLALLVTASQQAPAIVIAGNGHVRKDFGIPSLARAIAKSPRLVTVGFIESDNQAEPGDAGLGLAPRSADTARTPEWALYDYVWITPAAAREDPCKGFQMPKR